VGGGGDCNTVRGYTIFGKENILSTAILPMSDKFHFFQLHIHVQCFIELISGFRLISVIIAMSLVNVMPSVFASFDVQLKFESFLSLLFEWRIGPIRKTVHLSLFSFNPDIF